MLGCTQLDFVENSTTEVKNCPSNIRTGTGLLTSHVYAPGSDTATVPRRGWMEDGPRESKRRSWKAGTRPSQLASQRQPV